jgi:hypothetical protein
MIKPHNLCLAIKPRLIAWWEGTDDHDGNFIAELAPAI